MTLLTFDLNGDIVGQGSGFFIRPGGTLVTNWHLLRGAVSASALLHTGAERQGITFLAGDSISDIALLKVPGAIPSMLPIRRSVPAIGSKVVVVGSPMGLGQTVSEGIVSAVRSLDEGNVVQVTAPVSPGSSGGPVLDEGGRVFAIATASLREGQQLNFAVPITQVMRLLRPDLIEQDLASVFARAPIPPSQVRAAEALDPNLAINNEDIGGIYTFNFYTVHADSLAAGPEAALQNPFRRRIAAGGEAPGTGSGVLLLSSPTGVGLLLVCASDRGPRGTVCKDADVGLVSFVLASPDGRLVMHVLDPTRDRLVVEGLRADAELAFAGPLPARSGTALVWASPMSEPPRLSDPTGFYEHGILAAVAHDTLYLLYTFLGSPSEPPEFWKGPIGSDGAFSLTKQGTIQSGLLVGRPVPIAVREDLSAKKLRGTLVGGVLNGVFLTDRGFDDVVVGSLAATRR